MFDRIEKLIGKEKLEKLKKSTVVIVGLGGVGGYALEALVRSGVGKVILVDYDKIDISNLNRQVITNQNNIGCYKTDEALKRVESINPDCEVILLRMKLDINNLDDLFSYSFDYLIDACDTLIIKEELICRCLDKNIKMISSMGTGNKLNPHELEVMDIWSTSYDPIARRIRKYLKDHHINNKVAVVCSKEQRDKFDKEIPSMIFVPAVSGLLCANYIVKEIINMK